MAAGCLLACRTSLGISKLHKAELQLQHPAIASAKSNSGHTHRNTASVYAGNKHRFLRSLFGGRELGSGSSKANARLTRRCAVVAKAGARRQKSTTVHDDSWEEALQIGPQKSTMLDFSAPEAPTRKGAERAGVQPLDEEWDEWEKKAVASDGGSGRRKGENAHEMTGGAVLRAPGNGGISHSAVARNARVLAEEEEIRREGAVALDGGDGEGTIDESEWELLSEEEEAAFLDALQSAETPIEVVVEEEEGTEAGEWRPVPDDEKEMLQEQLDSTEKQPLTIERVLEDGATAPVGADEAEGLGVLWDAPGPMEIERVGEQGPETLEQAEIERLQRLWEGPADGEGGVPNAEVSGAGLRPDEVPESGEDWEDFSEQQLLRVQQQLKAFREQFFVEDLDCEESDEDSSDGEILGGLQEDVWEGDLEGEMTPEEEAELLREAERELAEGSGSLEEEDEDAKLVRQLNESSNFGESVRVASISYDEESSEEEGELLRGTEAELRELSGETEFDMSEDGDWEEEEGEELTEDEALVRLLNQERAAELESSDDEDEEIEEDESEDVWVGDLRGQMTPEEEAELLAAAEKELAALRGSQNGVLENGSVETAVLKEVTGIDAGEDAVRRKMADTLRAFVDTSPRKRKKKPPGERAVFVGEDVEDPAEGGPFTAADEAKMLKRMEKELSELRKEDKYEDLDEEGREKKKLPMEMRCFDTAKVYVKAGDGGNGCVAFRREKFVAYGGPSGGNGGRGGHVFVEVDQGMNSLQPFRKQIHFRAGRGGHGEGSKCEGPKGDDITIKVPPGTVIKRAREGGEEEGEWLMELVKPGEKQVLIPGGRGGRGNTSFKSSQNKAPVIAENGEEGREMWVELELKLVADVGIVGVPNAGKSTLLSVISAARPKIANYPFTTLVPNLGVVEIDYETIVFADVPGLLEGAHTGHGLGQEFLRHCERSRVLVHMIDGTSPQPVHDFEAICNEMALFNPTLAQKPQIVAFNKMDLPEAQEAWPAFQAAMLERGIEPVAISAVAQENVTTILRQTQALLKEIANPYAFDPFERQERKVKVTVPSNDTGPPIDVFSIEQDPHTRTWTVIGEGLERFTQMTNWEYYEAIKRFQKVLDASGVNQELRRRGVREGDTVELGEMEFSWMDKEDWNTFGDGWTRGTRGSKHWPH